ncbi:Mam Domain-Containing Glycosylphosphatidylinositol Anchor Protein 1 [Manis pentadactyla]|nr:Mam Domain-Containing Glycosylphosphatidylinositol Anchor Protein 1 [Manis pentadactyla]
MEGLRLPPWDTYHAGRQAPQGGFPLRLFRWQRPAQRCWYREAPPEAGGQAAAPPTGLAPATVRVQRPSNRIRDPNWGRTATQQGRGGGKGSPAVGVPAPASVTLEPFLLDNRLYTLHSLVQNTWTKGKENSFEKRATPQVNTQTLKPGNEPVKMSDLVGPVSVACRISHLKQPFLSLFLSRPNNNISVTSVFTLPAFCIKQVSVN